MFIYPFVLNTKFSLLIVQAIIQQLRWFAGPQIRSVASLGGNIATASPISDLNPILAASKVMHCIRSFSGQSKHFFPLLMKHIIILTETFVA